MKLLFLLSLIVLVSGDGAFVAERTAVGNDVSPQETVQAQPSFGEIIGEKKLGKRSYASLPLVPGYIGSSTPALPWYRSSGLSSYGLYRYGLPLQSLGLPLQSLGLPLQSLGLPLQSLGLPLQSLGLPLQSLSLPSLYGGLHGGWYKGW